VALTPSPAPALSPLDQRLADWLDGSTPIVIRWHDIKHSGFAMGYQKALRFAEGITAHEFYGVLLGMRAANDGERLAFVGMEDASGGRFFVPFRAGFPMDQSWRFGVTLYQGSDLGSPPEYCYSDCDLWRSDLEHGEYDGHPVQFIVGFKCLSETRGSELCDAITMAKQSAQELVRFGKAATSSKLSDLEAPGFINDSTPEVGTIPWVGQFFVDVAWPRA
jgi:hypothetical protein